MMDELRDCLINRELSWLAFNGRVLEEAADPENPLLERLKFTAIFSSNLDEFFMVRVAGLRQQSENAPHATDATGLTAAEQLRLIRTETARLVAKQGRILGNKLLPALAAAGIRIVKPADLGVAAQQRLTQYFERQVLPILTPVAVDQSHPFPIVNNQVIEIMVRVRRPGSNRRHDALVEVPGAVPRFIDVTPTGKSAPAPRTYVLLEDLVITHLDRLFAKCTILDAFPFRVTRDMDFDVDDEGVADLLMHLEHQLKRRRQREPIRLEVPTRVNRRMVRWLQDRLNLRPAFVYTVTGPLAPVGFFELVAKEERADLREPAWPPLPPPAVTPDEPLFASLKRHPVIPIFLPFESFDPVVRLLTEAADDPNVLAIKQTLYRVSGDSPIVRALERAAEAGKQVTVIVEVKARFDEERNIAWARRLEEAGAHVVYGIAGLKIHCKALLIVRLEDGLIARYLHLATGNYNDRTARVYTDIGIFLRDPDICADVAALFNVMTGYAEPPEWRQLAVAPFNLRSRFLELIDREARLSTPHQPGQIVAKMNSLVDPEIIEHLYAAARQGVMIDLTVRGTCCLRPDVDTRNIRVVSIVDRYLEHSRIYRFDNGGRPEYFLSSADWMPRNLDRRIELLFPVTDGPTRELLDYLLGLSFKDRRKGRRLRRDGTYSPPGKTHGQTRSQRCLYEHFDQRLAEATEEADQDRSPAALEILRHLRG